MAQVVAPRHSRHASNMGNMPVATGGGPTIEMIQNPDFSFPRQPQTFPPQLQPSRRGVQESERRPVSMHINLPPANFNAQRRAVSTLPSFTFNSDDASGLKQTPTTTPPETPNEEPTVTPSRRGHRRGGSELVGGDSKTGVFSSSPTKTHAMPLPLPPPGPPAGRRGHSHRRSQAISSHDLGNIMKPAEAQPRLSSSLPTTPMELPHQTPPLDRAVSEPNVNDPFGPALDDALTRPPSRPRVGFSDNVEIIPRPLSTISSDTEGSLSTARGHSMNNSISSVLSLGTPSPPSFRPQRPSMSADLDDEPKARARSSVEISKRVEKEGEWLKSRSSQSLKRPLSESAAAPLKTTFVEPEQPARRRPIHNKKHSLGQALGFDRRRSEPTIGMGTNAQSGHSAVSLQSSVSNTSIPSESVICSSEHTSSTQKIKAWASSKILKKSRDVPRPLSESSSRSSMRPDSAGNVFVPGKISKPAPAVAETNLDAVLDAGPMAIDQRPATPSQPRIEVSSASPALQSSLQTSRDDDDEDNGRMLDLDAALGPFKTPNVGGQNRQRAMHSSRLIKDFGGPGGHYHRRAESAPNLPPFESQRISTPSQSSMADVFEEDEEDDAQAGAAPAKAGSTYSLSEDESSIGIEVVDSANSGNDEGWHLGSEDGLGIQRGDWEPERPSTSYSNQISRLSTSGTDRRSSLIIEETIFEEASPVEGVQIVQAEEEPRASSLTKSSDSSETPTLLGLTADLRPIGQTPDTYQTSNFSSPDYDRRQASFDASRLNTAASSIADNRTTSSCMTGEPESEMRISSDDVPSLTSSRSTMLSTAQANTSRRDVSGNRTPSASSAADNAALAAERRYKRGSIQSLSQLVGNPFSNRSKDLEDARPKTAAEPPMATLPAKKKKEHRLKKLMFWKAKHDKSALRSAP